MPEGSQQAEIRARLGRTIGRIARRWRVLLDHRLAPHGLTEARWTALLRLARGDEGLTQGTLAERLGVEGPTLVRTLDRLEREGLVERRPLPRDRRAKTVHLTEAARPLVGRIEAEAAAVRAEILAGIPEAELALCLAVLERVAEGLEAADGRRGAR